MRRLPMNRIAQFDQASLKDTVTLISPKMFHRQTKRKALRCAVQGLLDAWQSQPNLRLHGYAGAAVIAAGIFFRLSLFEWLWISFAIGLVIFAELMNTAIEQTVDLVVGLRPDPLARQVKDIAAGCVLVAASLALVIGGLTFLPHLLSGLKT